jgi:hypothetical protein
LREKWKKTKQNKTKKINTSGTQWNVEKRKAKAGQKTSYERVGSHLSFLQMKWWVDVRK